MYFNEIYLNTYENNVKRVLVWFFLFFKHLFWKSIVRLLKFMKQLHIQNIDNFQTIKILHWNVFYRIIGLYFEILTMFNILFALNWK